MYGGAALCLPTLHFSDGEWREQPKEEEGYPRLQRCRHGTAPGAVGGSLTVWFLV